MDANPQLRQTYVRLQRQIAENDRQIALNQAERAERLKALEALKDHAPQPSAEKPAAASKTPQPAK